MYKWIQGTELRPQGRAFVYGALFDEVLKGLADRSYWEHPPIKQLGTRQVVGGFHTLQSTDAVQKLGVPIELIKEQRAQTLPHWHTIAERMGTRTIDILPAYSFQLPLCSEENLPITSQEDVIFIGSYHNSLRLVSVIQAGISLYHHHLAESLEREGKLASVSQKIPHTFSVTSFRDLSDETPLLMYLTNRFVTPVRIAVGEKQKEIVQELEEELRSFGAGTTLENYLGQLADALIRPSCRHYHREDYQSAHLALIQYIAENKFEKAQKMQSLINEMKL